MNLSFSLQTGSLELYRMKKISFGQKAQEVPHVSKQNQAEVRKVFLHMQQLCDFVKETFVPPRLMCRCRAAAEARGRLQPGPALPRRCFPGEAAFCSTGVHHLLAVYPQPAGLLSQRLSSAVC